MKDNSCQILPSVTWLTWQHRADQFSEYE